MPLQYASQVSDVTVVSLFNGWLSRKTYWWKEGRRLRQHAAQVSDVTVVSLFNGWLSRKTYWWKEGKCLYNMLPRSVT